MAVVQTHITSTTPMGATLLPDGATFRFWAPRAQQVYLVLNPGDTYQPDPADQLACDAASGHWVGFAPGVTNGTTYLFRVVGEGSSGFKRDPWARELGGSWPQYVCVVLDGYQLPMAISTGPRAVGPASQTRSGLRGGSADGRTQCQSVTRAVDQ